MPPGQATVSPYFTVNDRDNSKGVETVRRPTVVNPGHA
jgi:hypothetical protein